MKAKTHGGARPGAGRPKGSTSPNTKPGRLAARLGAERYAKLLSMPGDTITEKLNGLIDRTRRAGGK